MWTYNYNYNNELYHFGIKGMKWGVRRFQNKNGSLTSAGRKRYSDAEQNVRDKKAAYKQTKKDSRNAYNKAYNYNSRHPIASNFTKKGKAQSRELWGDTVDKMQAEKKAKTDYKQAKKEYANTPEAKKARAQKALKIGAAVAGTALAAYGAKKVYDIAKEKKVKTGKIAADKRRLDIVNSTYNQAMEMLKDNAGSSNPITGGRVYDKYGYYEVIKNATEQGIRRHNY